MFTFNTDITIYSHWKQGREEKWVRTSTHNASWYGKQAVSVGDAGLIAADQHSVRIREQDMGAYCIPDLWEGTGWTVQPGDIVVKGLVDDEITTGPTQITGKYKACFTVTAAFDNRRVGLKHLRIEGK